MERILWQITMSVKFLILGKHTSLGHTALLRNKGVQWLSIELRPQLSWHFFQITAGRCLAIIHDSAWLNFSNEEKINIPAISHNWMHWMQLRPLGPVLYVVRNPINTKWLGQCFCEHVLCAGHWLSSAAKDTADILPSPKSLWSKTKGLRYLSCLKTLLHFWHLHAMGFIFLPDF